MTAAGREGRRKPESGHDYFGARYYSSALGRFLTPDWSAAPEAVPYANIENPQTLNLYAYVGNNPVTATDPDGHICFLGIGNTCGSKSKGTVKEGGVGAVGIGAAAVEAAADGGEAGAIAGPPGILVGAVVAGAGVLLISHWLQNRASDKSSGDKVKSADVLPGNRSRDNVSSCPCEPPPIFVPGEIRVSGLGVTKKNVMGEIDWRGTPRGCTVGRLA